MTESLSRRWLVASLVLNLFFACGLVGGAWSWWRAYETAASPMAAGAAASAQTRGLRFAADDLTREQRQRYRIGLRDARREVTPAIETARAGRRELPALIAAPQFDRAATSAALARIREADTAARARVEQSVVEFASTLSAEDRKLFASGLMKRTTLAPQTPAPPTPAN